MGDVLRARCGERDVKLSGPPQGYHSPSTSIGFPAWKLTKLCCSRVFVSTSTLPCTHVDLWGCKFQSSNHLIFLLTSTILKLFRGTTLCCIVNISSKGAPCEWQKYSYHSRNMSLRSLVPGTGNKDHVNLYMLSITFSRSAVADSFGPFGL